MESIREFPAPHHLVAPITYEVKFRSLHLDKRFPTITYHLSCSVPPPSQAISLGWWKAYSFCECQALCAIGHGFILSLGLLLSFWGPPRCHFFQDDFISPLGSVT